MLKLTGKTGIHFVSKFLPQDIMGYEGENSHFTVEKPEVSEPSHVASCETDRPPSRTLWDGQRWKHTYCCVLAKNT